MVFIPGMHLIIILFGRGWALKMMRGQLELVAWCPLEEFILSRHNYDYLAEGDLSILWMMHARLEFVTWCSFGEWNLTHAAWVLNTGSNPKVELESTDYACSTWGGLSILPGMNDNDARASWVCNMVFIPGIKLIIILFGGGWPLNGINDAHAAWVSNIVPNPTIQIDSTRLCLFDRGGCPRNIMNDDRAAWGWNNTTLIFSGNKPRFENNYKPPTTSRTNPAAPLHLLSALRTEDTLRDIT